MERKESESERKYMKRVPAMMSPIEQAALELLAMPGTKIVTSEGDTVVIPASLQQVVQRMLECMRYDADAQVGDEETTPFSP